jgi:ABC-2 type transport system permease protein
MNIYLYELKALRKSAILWTCSITAISVLFLSVFTSMAEDAADFREIMAGYPEAVRKMLSINLDYIASILGFYSFVFIFIQLCGTVQAANLGVSILSKESRERTADFLLVKPVSRAYVISAKLLAALTNLLVTDAIFVAVSLIVANSVNTADFDAGRFIMINLTMLFVQLIFLAAGLLISVFFNKIKNVLPISLGMVFGFYIIGALLVSDDEALRFISPFKYYNVTYIIQNAAYEIPYLILGAAIVAVSIAACYIIYCRKDIHAVS